MKWYKGMPLSLLKPFMLAELFRERFNAQEKFQAPARTNSASGKDLLSGPLVFILLYFTLLKFI